MPPELLSDRFRDAMALAFELHRAQRRKKTDIPYVSHLMSVCALVLEHGGTEDQAIAALLHDAVEDQGGSATAQRIRERFGDEVAALVLGCTDGDPDEARGASTWRSRKERYIAHLASVPDAVCLISAADKLHNARSILSDLRDHGDELWSRFSGGKDGTLWYYRSLVEAFRPRSTSPLRRLVAELDRTVQAIAALS